jgi:hypothetical protein
MYRFKNVKQALQRRFENLADPRWEDAMVKLISARRIPYFRWFDSGDLQSVELLGKICRVAERTPHIKHWMPTREYNIVREYVATHTLPDNLIIRLSAHFVNQPVRATIPGCACSTVSSGPAPVGAHRCPALQQDGKCGKCRACWSKKVLHVDYKLH